MEALMNRVIILPEKGKLNEKGEEVTDFGFVTKTAKEVNDTRDQTSIGTIIDFGPSAWLDPIMGGKPCVDIGDRVIYAKFSGKFIVNPEDEKEYVVVNDDAIQVRL